MFIETYRRSWFPLGREMVQANRADRQAGAIVGLHYHLHQADYWTSPGGSRGAARPEARFAHRRGHACLDIDADNAIGVFIPPGMAHGFATLTDLTIAYMVDSYYNPADELGVAWDDPDVAADWGVTGPVLSSRDQANPRRADLSPALRPHDSLRR